MSYKLPEGWEETSLGEIFDYRSGLSKGRKYFGSGYPFLGFKDIFNNFFVPENLNEFVESTEKERDNMSIEEGDVFLTRTSETFNELGMSAVALRDYNNATFNGFTKRLRPKDKEILYPKFSAYYFRSNIFRNQVDAIATMTTRASLNNSMLDSMSIIIPPLPEQKSVADTLSILDDKIELNNKINKNLEEQAQLLFKHWFGDFEFPNEEGLPYKSNGGEMIDSELGMIPKGWEVNSLGKSNLGKLKTSGIEEFEGEKIYLATADISDTRIVNESTKVTLNDKPSRANMQPTPNTVWFAKMKDSRKLILVDENDYRLQNRYILSTGFAGIQATKLSVYYLWTYIQSEAFDEIKNLYSTGTTMQAINNKNINQIKIPIPNDEILKQFSQVVEPMYKKIINSRIQNQKLSEIRNTLLPKLMSGEVRIPLD
ncbi:type I restriction enzyme, S subunit [Atopostipes suicloacalis DSM 15692]|uniref:Type I restriction enzyme, S subunit n=1 Tax=Atopostipes suicloacalis DSM 15692 TaxID=1121025 RepID=A0A1M4TCW1_9LACT|nr:restriction endonuclease subunit S [Atopostipes suicloacalis]SHE42316.1 type I restriction enzyme, S subunit [Atopostipes suicloacalis DSM 15692]